MALTRAQVADRRNKVSKLLAKSVIKPADIACNIGVEVKAINNDLEWLKKNSSKVLDKYALDNYVFQTINTIEQLRDIELELQSMRQNTTGKEKIMVIHELKDTINLRWQIEGDGLTNLHMTKAANLKDQYGR